VKNCPGRKVSGITWKETLRSREWCGADTHDNEQVYVVRILKI
jgi:hypothetical protein